MTVDFRFGQVDIDSSSERNTDCAVEDMLAGHEGLYDKGTHKYCCSMDEDGELKIKFKFSRPMRFSGYDI